jgi:hypothetical protein
MEKIKEAVKVYGLGIKHYNPFSRMVNSQHDKRLCET